MRLSTSLLACSLPLYLLAETPQECKTTAQPYRVTLRNIEGNGVGYNTGYTTIELFSSVPSQVPTSLIPFLDLRFHLLNNGKPACNAGLGMRFLTSSWAWGINAYYDYRKTSWQHYNQVSLGLEALGKVWDFRLNGYLPVGAKHGSLHDPKFSSFHGNHVILSQKREFVMKGLDGEVGIHIKKIKHASFYGAIGPYYFEGLGKNAIGGEARLNATFFDHIKAEISTSYDNIFQQIFQGQLSLLFPMGPKKTLRERSNHSCSRETRLRERALQPVDRKEIVVVTKKREHHAAINPRTGLPFHFIFVDNTSHSLGTYESPYSTLAQAQQASSPYDIIYVFPGDGTTTGYDTGFLMKDHQKLLGSGIAYLMPAAQGIVPIPKQSTTPPQMILATNPGNSKGIINMGNHCEVSGFALSGTLSSSAIFAQSIEHLSIQNNSIEGTFSNGAIALQDCSGLCTLQGNTLSTIVGSGIYITDSSPNPKTLVAANNTFLNLSSTAININPQGDLSCSIANNQITNTKSNALVISSSSGALVASISHNTITNANGSGVNLIQTSPLPLSANIFGNTISFAQGDGIHAETDGLGPLTATIANNQITQSNHNLFLHSNVEIDATITNNRFTSATLDAIKLEAPTSGSITATLTGNQLSNSGNGGISVYAPSGNITASVCNNQILNAQYDGIRLQTSNPSSTVSALVCHNILNNIGSSVATSGKGIYIGGNYPTTGVTAIVTGNQIFSTQNVGILMNGSIDSSLSISENQIDSALQGINLTFRDLLSATITDNLIENPANDCISFSLPDSDPTNIPQNLLIKNNTLSGLDSNSNGLVVLSSEGAPLCTLIQDNTILSGSSIGTYSNSLNIRISNSNNSGTTSISGTYTQIPTDGCNCN